MMHGRDFPRIPDSLNTGHGKDISKSLLQRLSQMAFVHSVYLGDTLIHFRREKSEVPTILALDMDVIYGYAFPNQCDAVHSVLCRSVLNSLPDQCRCIIPPGTVAELYNKLSLLWGATNDAEGLARVIRRRELSDNVIDQLDKLRRSLVGIPISSQGDIPLRLQRPRVQASDEAFRVLLSCASEIQVAAKRIHQLLERLTIVPTVSLFDGDYELMDKQLRDVPLDILAGRLSAKNSRRDIPRNNRADAMNLALLAAHHSLQQTRYFEQEGRKPDCMLRLATATPALVYDADILDSWDYDFWVDCELHLPYQARHDSRRAKLVADIIELRYHSVFRNTYGDDTAKCADMAQSELERCTDIDRMILEWDRTLRGSTRNATFPRGHEILSGIRAIDSKHVPQLLVFIRELNKRIFSDVLDEVHRDLAQDYAVQLTKDRTINRLQRISSPLQVIESSMGLLSDVKSELTQIESLLVSRQRAQDEGISFSIRTWDSQMLLDSFALEVKRKKFGVEKRYKLVDCIHKRPVLGLIRHGDSYTLYWHTAQPYYGLITSLSNIVGSQTMFDTHERPYRAHVDMKWGSEWHPIWSTENPETSLYHAYTEAAERASIEGLFPTALRADTSIGDFLCELVSSGDAGFPVIYVASDVLMMKDLSYFYGETAYAWRAPEGLDCIIGSLIHQEA